MGLDWAAYVHFVDDRPSLASWLNVGYAMIGWPLFAIPVVLAANRRYRRIEEFTFAFGVALAATTIISALVPAIGVYHEIGLDPASLKNINPAPISISCAICRRLARACCAISSFWGSAALLLSRVFTRRLPCCSLGLWTIRWLRPLALLVNAAMLAATPLNGGHYFIDLIGGVVVRRWRSSRRAGSGRSSRAGKAASTSLRRCLLWFLRSKAGNRKRALRHQNQHDQHRGKPDLGLDVGEDQDKRTGGAKSSHLAGAKALFHSKSQQNATATASTTRSYI